MRVPCCAVPRRAEVLSLHSDWFMRVVSSTGHVCVCAGMMIYVNLLSFSAYTLHAIVSRHTLSRLSSLKTSLFGRNRHGMFQ